MRLILLLAGLAVVLSAATASAVDIGVEPFAGVSAPVLQDDRTQGAIWGLRVPVNVVPFLTVEPYFSGASYGDKKLSTIAGSITRDGGKLTAFGANLLLSAGGSSFKFYPFVGFGSDKDKRASTPDLTKTGYNFGLGVGLGLPMKLALDVRGEMQMVVDGDVSRKFVNATAGVSYHVLALPKEKP
jgi:hypothetical protein